MKVLFIGGTGNISTSVSRHAVAGGIDLYLLTRGTRKVDITGATQLRGDINRLEELKEILATDHWDVVVNWIAFNEQDIKRDLELFQGKTGQYIFISSASAYQKPLAHPVVTESTPLKNPYWQYSRDKIRCEALLMHAYRESNFPVTIVRPSHTYDTVLPVAMGGWTEYTLIERMKQGKKIIIHGDGTSLWTLTHAKDFTKGFIGLLGNPQAIGHAFHITSDEILTWNQIYSILADAVGVTADVVHIASDFIAAYDEEQTGNLLGDKAHSVIFDNTKIKRFVPGFKATIPFAKGIKETLAWFEADSSRQIINEATNTMMDTIITVYEERNKCQGKA